MSVRHCKALFRCPVALLNIYPVLKDIFSSIDEYVVEVEDLVKNGVPTVSSVLASVKLSVIVKPQVRSDSLMYVNVCQF